MQRRADEIVEISAPEQVGQMLVEVLLRPGRARVAAVAVKHVENAHSPRWRAIVL